MLCTLISLLSLPSVNRKAWNLKEYKLRKKKHLTTPSGFYIIKSNILNIEKKCPSLKN